MPKDFSKYFRAEGCTVYYRKRRRGNSIRFEARYRRRGYNISVSGPSLDIVRERFIQAIKETESGQQALRGVPTGFSDFAEYYFANFWIRKVSEETAKNEMGRYRRYIKPYFGNRQIKLITPDACQKLIDSLTAEEKNKTAAEIKSMLNGIFKMAVKYRLIDYNPIDVVFYVKQEGKHGKALTLDEERELLAKTAGTPYQIMFAVGLYTGLRPGEYKTARIEGNFIVAVNSKRKKHQVEYKRIPITPMLRPYLEGVTELIFYMPNRIGEKFRSILPDHRPYDMRVTFNSRCKECGIDDAARKEFMGHTDGALDRAYTCLSDEYLIREGEKLKY